MGKASLSRSTKMSSKYKFIAGNRNWVVQPVTKTHLTYSYKPLLLFIGLPSNRWQNVEHEKDAGGHIARRPNDTESTTYVLGSWIWREDNKTVSRNVYVMRGIAVYFKIKVKGHPLTCHDCHREGNRGTLLLVLNLNNKTHTQRRLTQLNIYLCLGNRFRSTRQSWGLCFYTKSIHNW